MLELKPYIIQILTAIIAGVSSFIGGGYIERKKKVAQLKSVESDAVTSMQRAYDEFVKDFNEKYSELQAEVKELKLKLTAQNKQITESQKYWEKKYNTLKKEFNDYKLKHP